MRMAHLQIAIPGRPFIEAKLMLENGIYMPMVITELGWLAGWNSLPHDWLADILRYNKLMMAHDNIVGSCLWNAGQWETAPNILSGKPLLDLGNQLRGMTPQFYKPGSIKLPENQPVPVPAPTPPIPTQPPITTTPKPPERDPADIGFCRTCERTTDFDHIRTHRFHFTCSPN